MLLAYEKQCEDCTAIYNVQIVQLPVLHINKGHGSKVEGERESGGRKRVISTYMHVLLLSHGT